MNIYQGIGMAISVYFVTALIVGCRTHKLKTRMKQFGNGMVSVGGLVLTMHIIIFGTMLIPKIIVFVQDFISTYDLDMNSALVLQSLPLVFIVALLVGISWFLYKVFSFNPFKYSEEERQFLIDERTKTRSEVKKFFGLAKRGKKL